MPYRAWRVPLERVDLLFHDTGHSQDEYTRDFNA